MATKLIFLLAVVTCSFIGITGAVLHCYHCDDYNVIKGCNVTVACKDGVCGRFLATLPQHGKREVFSKLCIPSNETNEQLYRQQGCFNLKELDEFNKDEFGPRLKMAVLRNSRTFGAHFYEYCICSYKDNCNADGRISSSNSIFYHYNNCHTLALLAAGISFLITLY